MWTFMYFGFVFVRDRSFFSEFTKTSITSVLPCDAFLFVTAVPLSCTIKIPFPTIPLNSGISIAVPNASFGCAAIVVPSLAAFTLDQATCLPSGLAGV